MPNYLINHTLLGPGPTNKDVVAAADGDRRKFAPETVVTEQQLTEAGFDIDRLLTAKPGGFSPAIIRQASPDNFDKAVPLPPPLNDPDAPPPPK